MHLFFLQKVEQLCKQGGVQVPEAIVTWKTGNTPDELANILNPEVRIKQVWSERFLPTIPQQLTFTFILFEDGSYNNETN